MTDSDSGSSVTRHRLLDEAQVHASRGQWQLAVDALRAAWLNGKHPRIATTAWRALRAFVRPEPISERLEKNTEAAWAALAQSGRAEVLPRLVVTPWPRHPRVARARIDALEAMKPDALISAYFEQFARSDPYGRQSELVVRRQLRMLAESNDPQIGPIISAVRAAEGPISPRDLGLVVRRPLPSPVALEATGLQALEQIERFLDQPSETAEALLKQVLENPNDDVPRAVLADALIELGDVRGEFIASQLAKQTEPAAVRRETELLRTYAPAWLGALSPFVEAPLGGWRDAFSRGFLSRAQLKQGLPSEVLSDSARWATIETLVLPYEFVYQPPYPGLRALRRIEGLSNVPENAIGPLDSAVVASAVVARVPFTSVRELLINGPFESGQRFNKEQQLVHIKDLARDAPWFHSVRRLWVRGGPRELAIAEEVLRAVPTLEAVGLSWGLTASGAFTHERWEALLSRARELTLSWHGRNWSGEPPEAVASVLTPSLLASLSSLVIEHQGRLAPAQRKAVTAAINQALSQAAAWPPTLMLFGRPLHHSAHKPIVPP